MAELVDALRSGRSGGNPVEVQVLFRPPLYAIAACYDDFVDYE